MCLMYYFDNETKEVKDIKFYFDEKSYDCMCEYNIYICIDIDVCLNVKK